MTGFRQLAVLSFWLLLGGISAPGFAAELRWNPQTETLDAALNDEPVSEVLLELGRLTKWKIWFEPGLESSVSARFAGLPAHRALRRILGDWHYALLPGKTGGKRLYIYRSSMFSATEELSLARRSGSGKTARIENELIVIPGKKFTGDIQELAQSLDAEIVGGSDNLGAWRFRFENGREAEEARTNLARNDAVRVEDNYQFDIPPYESSPRSELYALPKVRAGKNPNTDQLMVAMLDTPMQADTPLLSEFLLPSVSVAGEPGELASDEPTHGTTMAMSFLHGLALISEPDQESSVRILPVDVYGAQEVTSTFQLAAGIVAGMESGARLFNLSLGGRETSPLLERVIREAHELGAVFIGAAGNEPGVPNVFPAAYPEFLAVTSSTPSGELASYANNGQFVDVIVPGHSFVPYSGKTYLIQGTSVSSAVVAGMTAGFAAESGVTLRQAEEQMRRALPNPPNR